MIKGWSFSQWWNPYEGDCVSIVESLIIRVKHILLIKETTEEAVEKGAFGSPTMLFTKGYVILDKLRLKGLHQISMLEKLFIHRL